MRLRKRTQAMVITGFTNCRHCQRLLVTTSRNDKPTDMTGDRCTVSVDHLHSPDPAPKHAEIIMELEETLIQRARFLDTRERIAEAFEVPTRMILPPDATNVVPLRPIDHHHTGHMGHWAINPDSAKAAQDNHSSTTTNTTESNAQSTESTEGEDSPQAG